MKASMYYFLWILKSNTEVILSEEYISRNYDEVVKLCGIDLKI